MIMGRADIVLAFARYEIRRAVARRKVLILIAFTVLLDVLPYYALSARSSLIPPSDLPYIWIVGVFAIQPLFLNFTAILIAAGAMSEEYEQGTAELLLSKPVNRGDFFLGKFLGGFVLFLGILFVNIFLNVASAYSAFGVQDGLSILPSFFFVQAFSSLLFYSLAFMLGELMRRSSLAYIFSSSLFFASLIINVYMGVIYDITGDALYNSLRYYLPTSPADSLPVQYLMNNLPSISNLRFISLLVGGTGVVEPSIEYSIVLILVYVIAGIAIASLYFSRADISKKIS
jgi:ABC-2 type transport system permease protein